MPIDDADLRRLQELVTNIRGGWWEEYSEEYVALAIELVPKLQKELEQVKRENLDWKRWLGDTEVKLAQTQEEVARLEKFVAIVLELNSDEGLSGIALWHLQNMAEQALSSKEAEDATV